MLDHKEEIIRQWKDAEYMNKAYKYIIKNILTIGGVIALLSLIVVNFEVFSFYIYVKALLDILLFMICELFIYDKFKKKDLKKKTFIVFSILLGIFALLVLINPFIS